jgi:hypothetical protein
LLVAADAASLEARGHPLALIKKETIKNRDDAPLHQKHKYLFGVGRQKNLDCSATLCRHIKK